MEPEDSAKHDEQNAVFRNDVREVVGGSGEERQDACLGLQVADTAGQHAAGDDDQEHAGPEEELAQVDLEAAAVDEVAQRCREAARVAPSLARHYS